ncbi:MAG: hypothetical protein QM696_03060 [Steroidobacteraceae bacterium]
MEPQDASLPLYCLDESTLAAWRHAQPPSVRSWLDCNAFKAEAGRWLILPDGNGEAAGVAVGLGAAPPGPQGWFWLAAGLADRLPSGNYQLADAPEAELFTLGWHYGSYRYSRYRGRSAAAGQAHLQPPAGADLRYVQAATRAATLARDLINTPANDLGPEELAQAARELAAALDGSLTVVQGADLDSQYPLIAAVGRGSPRAPRLIDLRLPQRGAPRVTLVGKGVCFDSGGLDIKPAAGMLLMKKDMGGAAAALATAQLLRELAVPVDLRVLVPAVENSVDGESFRPGDIWPSRKGLTVEIGNTDAEGRLVLADALAAASEEQPELIIDFATLTGAARIALGPELPAAYSGDAALLEQLARAGGRLADPLWPMPLWEGYDEELASRLADLNNAPASGLGGSITAALFLRRFIARPAQWIHLDLYAWNGRERPGRPVGAEAQCIRAVAALLQQRYG